MPQDTGVISYYGDGMGFGCWLLCCILTNYCGLPVLRIQNGMRQVSSMSTLR